MTVNLLQMKKALSVALFVLLLSVVGLSKMYADNITFADNNVEVLCVANWDADGDGGLSYDEAAAVTDLGAVFKNTIITSFDELQYFIGLASIGDYTFHHCSGLSSIVIPNSVTSIGERAFSGCCSLTSIEIPNSVIGIGDFAFESSGLITIEIPYSVTGMGVNPFVGCNLEQINVNPENPVFDSRNNCNAIIWTSMNDIISGCRNTVIPNDVTILDQWSFGCCNGLTTIEIPNSVIIIGPSSFNSCRDLITIEIPESVNSIYLHAFAGCSNLTTVEISNSVTFIGESVFSACSSLAHIIVDVGNTVYDSREDCNAIIKTSTNELVTGCKNTIIPNSVTSIGSNAFFNCNGLTSIIIPNFVTSIGSNAFFNCNGLTSIIIPNSVTSIGDHAFGGCTGLTSINIPNSVTSIGDYTFDYCSGLTSIEIPNSVTFIGTNPFRRCSSIEQIIVDLGNTVYDSRNNCNAIVKTSSNELIAGCKNTVIPNEATSILEYAFADCTELNSIEIPNSVTTIGNYAFSGCCSLTSMTIHAEIPPVLGDSVFENVIKTIPVFVPTGTVSDYQTREGWNEFTNYIENTPFSDNISFADANVKALCVANWDTDGDGELSYVEAASVLDLGQVFKGGTTITSFDELQYFTGLISIGINAFWYCRNMTSIVIPNSVTRIEYDAFYKCSSLTTINIPNTVTSIGNFAFSNCTGLTSVSIPNSVTYIGDGAFISCTSLTSIYIPNPVTTIGTNPFRRCSSIEQIIVDIGNKVYDSRNNCNAIVKTSSNELIAGCKNTVIPEGVKAIGISTFENATGLTEITLPESLVSIGEYAFSNCESLTTINAEGLVPPTIYGNTFINLNHTNITLYVPCGSASDYRSATYWNDFPNMIDKDCSQTVVLEAGWTWWAPTVETNVDAIADALGDNMEAIQAKEGTPSGNTVPGQMYRIKVRNSCNLSVDGVRPSTVTVNILLGTNWFGYAGTQSMDIESLSITPAEGDKIISQDGGFAIFNGTSWQGTLETLQPGHGYVYYSTANAPKTLFMGQ